MVHFIRSVFLVILVGSAGQISAQGNNCAVYINEATAKYNNGQISQSLATAKKCKSNNHNDVFAKQRIMALCHLALNQNDSARKAALVIMELNPRYKPSVLRNPEEFIQLIESINIIPKVSLRLSLSVGANRSLLDVTGVYMINDQVKTYSGLGATQLSISGQYQLSRLFAIQTGVRVAPKRFDLNSKFNELNVDITESLTYGQMPLVLQFSPYTKGRVKPMLSIGGYGAYLLSATNSFNATSNISDDAYGLLNISSYERRNKWDYGLAAGAGLLVKLGEGQLVIEVDYFKSYTNITNTALRYSFPELLNPYYHLDDDVTISTINFNIGYQFFLNYKVLK
ncbi:MAG: PorT family protein [Bacteroidetes bacterium]|nr:PorT family protein [Bacteroidota bacterium]